ncbi:YeeE/YedE thiosulfate transporter family protein [Mucilaginibacter gossypii]|uniref:YeeE/YedE family protein n=1 Tax=Mucilaginibacter gossypii TaxID=551996 RepID=UPI000DCC9143|nr:MULTISPECIES: YeeE/YedE thiosulfate transporter family protein [Mucilaginibacter]QTE36339.1 YeeE/YedE thiosulfate transporter family protein [Mucilaginibacter gossypii]RAV60073.1 YeeE/YedE family protein [Mucilaginibacter rubeus]
MDIIKQPWPWYVAGPLIGLIVPALLILGNKTFGISSTLRQICAACIPANISFFKYDWKKDTWNLFFIAGIVIGGSIAAHLLSNPGPVGINPKTIVALQQQGIKDFSGLLPRDIFSFKALTTLKGFVFIVIGGFLVGFGTRYAGGCTSGHAIMGISSLQWPSLVATCCFMIGGFVMTWLILPYLLQL